MKKREVQIQALGQLASWTFSKASLDRDANPLCPIQIELPIPSELLLLSELNVQNQIEVSV